MTTPAPNTVLLLDDDQDLLDSLKMLIETMTDRVALTVRSMEEALSRKEVVLGCESAILDINLGFDQPNGIDVYRWLRSNGFTRPICFLTGHGSFMPEVAEALRLGDVKVYSKPIEIPLFLKIVMGSAV